MVVSVPLNVFFFFQAEDGIRDVAVTGVQTCALPIFLYACPHSVYPSAGDDRWVAIAVVGDDAWERFAGVLGWPLDPALRSEERRVGKECRSRWSPYH